MWPAYWKSGLPAGVLLTTLALDEIRLLEDNVQVEREVILCAGQAILLARLHLGDRAISSPYAESDPKASAQGRMRLGHMGALGVADLREVAFADRYSLVPLLADRLRHIVPSRRASARWARRLSARSVQAAGGGGGLPPAGTPATTPTGYLLRWRRCWCVSAWRAGRRRPQRCSCWTTRWLCFALPGVMLVFFAA